MRTFTENLMAYALGRRVEYFDQPAIRAITKAAEANDYKMSSFILGVVKSDAFRMQRVEPEAATTETNERADDSTPSRRPIAMNFITGKHMPRRTFLRGHGRHGGAAVPRRDGAGRAPARLDGRGRSARA